MKQHSRVIPVARIVISLIVFTAVAVQLADSIARGSSLTNFFSFFTIQSNIIAATVLLIVGIGTFKQRRSTPEFAFIRGAATLYMTMTGVIFALLLAGLVQDLQTTIPWVNTTLHYIMPFVMLTDWLLHPPKFKFTFKQTVWWLVFPIAYLIYSLIRGSFVGWYPYPFINPLTSGWASVIVICIIISVGTVAGAGILTLRTRNSSK